MNNMQWTMLTMSGIMFIVSVNVWAAKRDQKLLESYVNNKSEQVQYKQLPVIPFSN